MVQDKINKEEKIQKKQAQKNTIEFGGGGSELFPATEKIYKEVKHELGPDVLLVFGYGKIMGQNTSNRNQYSNNL